MKTGNSTCFVVAAISILLIAQICFAFDDGDFQYWSSADASLDIDKDWKVTFREEFRLGDDAEQLYRHHSDVGLVYKSLADWIDLGINYRQVFEKDSKGQWRQENRPHLNITLKGQLFDLGLSSRSRFEYRDREDKNDLWRYRNKVAVKLPFKLTDLKIQPYVADEVFINFNADDFNRNRIYSGFSFQLTENIKGDIFYLWQTSESSGHWKDINVLGTRLKFYF